MKKVKQKTLRNKLDKLWRETIKARAGNKCEKCTRSFGKLDCHHIFGKKAHPATRWDLANGVLLCVKCHKFGKGSAHETPKEFMDWIIKVRGIQWYELLLVRANLTQKVDKLQLLEHFQRR